MERGHESDVMPYDGIDLESGQVANPGAERPVALSEADKRDMEETAIHAMDQFKTATTADAPKYLIQAMFMARLYQDGIIKGTTLTQVTTDYAPYAAPFEQMWLGPWEPMGGDETESVSEDREQSMKEYVFKQIQRGQAEAVVEDVYRRFKPIAEVIHATKQ